MQKSGKTDYLKSKHRKWTFETAKHTSKRAVVLRAWLQILALPLTGTQYHSRLVNHSPPPRLQLPTLKLIPRKTHQPRELRERYFRPSAELPGFVRVGGAGEPVGGGPSGFASEPKALLEDDHSYASCLISVTLHTDVGDIKIEVFCERTPKTCENFLALCASNYYNGCIFHRNIKGFMVQTGDPTGTGRGGSSIWGKKFEDEYSEYLKHNVRGVVSMANNGPNTNGSQFFITYGKQPHLDMKYTVFGKVIDGLETLDELEKLPVNEKTYRPLNDVHIKDITIHANPFAQ
ncbi:PREDICTED: peptidyl-prolyl cis-trans isomerase-like 3 [Lipotes vexillifer]|uniref:Peptidyl-prolyl cis-trans isomerase n=3 Tax=Odontoceti TaxID=9722 RepID=A0A340YCZ2_LIPVE|nr:PREDICTED: peptidyl-prolyl cis-trans isomerase-like 3 [Lipotes vexillifer]